MSHVLRENNEKGRGRGRKGEGVSFKEESEKVELILRTKGSSSSSSRKKDQKLTSRNQSRRCLKFAGFSGPDFLLLLFFGESSESESLSEPESFEWERERAWS